MEKPIPTGIASLGVVASPADTFTGYDASFQLQAADGSTVATLNREGVDYFAGSLTDGTPVTIWRD